MDGIFEIANVPKGRHARAETPVLLVCRAGRLFGADTKGRVYVGVLQAASRHARKSLVNAAYEGLPRRTASPFPAITISGEIDPSAHRQRTTIIVKGRRIAVEITYLGPLPQLP